MKLEVIMERKKMTMEEANLVCEMMKFHLKDAGYKTKTIKLKESK
jgi:hypothetical protein